jgi:hypothetical protein
MQDSQQGKIKVYLDCLPNLEESTLYSSCNYTLAFGLWARLTANRAG